MVLLGSFGCSEKDLANLIWIPNYRTLASNLISLESSLSIYRIRILQHISFGDSEANMNFLPLSLISAHFPRLRSVTSSLMVSCHFSVSPTNPRL